VRQPGDGTPGVVGAQGRVEAAVEAPRHLGQRPDQLGGRGLVDLEVVIEEAEGKAARAEQEVLLRQPDQPRELAACGGQPVVEPQQHPHRQVGLAADRGHRGGLRRAAAVLRVGHHQDPVCTPVGGTGHVADVEADDLEHGMC